ncbi:sensor histidine kinase [Streptomyces ochraceiscleroticus]|uniref:Sensor histidine kinase n=1 Tax=Streptomyces ochraceiscleroticus TaxID=47761 RepID=A0ABW1MVN4_9ACTN|nr:ATP-binding protein [Streptomyces ochraceiscleroticus]
MTAASTLLADVFTHALTEGLSRASAPRVRPVAAVPDDVGAVRDDIGAPRRAPRRGGPAPDPVDAALHRFTGLLGSRSAQLPGGQPDEEEARYLRELARHALGRTASRAAAPAVTGRPAPDQLLAAAMLLTECLLLQGLDAGAVLPLLCAVRETFAAAAGPHPRAVDAWQGRRTLARDVHDRVATPLAAALDRLGAEAGTVRASEQLTAARDLLAQAAESSRGIVAGLHERTPVPRLRESLEEFLRGLPEGPEVRWHQSGDETTLPELFRRELLLVLREAVLNARTHAGAETVSVTVRTTRRWAHAQVCDDGRGFDVAHTLSARPAYGLRAMSERIESVGGRLAVTSRAGDGTRVDVHLPRYQAG